MKFFDVFTLDWYFTGIRYDYIKNNIIVIKGYEDENKRNINKLNINYNGFKAYIDENI